MFDGTRCALCEQPKTLCMSHIVPSFVFRWLKETSATGYLRCLQKPNARTQDGLKVEMLCKECEGRFNEWETPFASKLFYPYHARAAQRFEYDKWMARCLASVCWRALLYLRWAGHLRDLPGQFDADVEAALSTWRAYLRDEREDVGSFELHVLPLDEIVGTTDGIPQRVHRYLLRGVQIDRVWTQQSAIVVVKLARLMVVGCIREPDCAQWEGTRISLESGVLGPGRIVAPDWLWKWIKQQAERVVERDSLLSERQEARITQTLDKDRQRAGQSETMEALLADLRLAASAAEARQRNKGASQGG